MNNFHPQHDGLLSATERERLIELLSSGCTSEAIDREARDFLLHRDAMTAWEARLRANDGVKHFVLGNHRVFDLMCRGETYEVLRGQNLFTGRVDVLKAMYRANNAIQRRSRHLLKLRVQSSIRSPEFVAIYSAGFHGTSFAVVEHVRGADLRAVVRRDGPLRMDAAARVCSQAAAGVAHLHALGMACINLQPNKMLLEEGAAVKLCDAGEGQPLGTVCTLPPPFGRLMDFISPEIIAGNEMTPASDVYSLGCVLYYAVTGKVPFPGGTEEDKRHAQLRHFPLDPRRLAADLDDGFVELMAAMMAKAPEKRIPSMEDVATRLKQWATPR